MTEQESKEYNSMKRAIHEIFDSWGNDNTIAEGALTDAILGAADITDEIDHRNQ